MRPTTGDTCLTDVCFTCSTVSENELFFIDLSSYRHKIHNVKQDMPMIIIQLMLDLSVVFFS